MHSREFYPRTAMCYTPLPPGVELPAEAGWLSIDGHTVFPSYGCTGGLSAKMIAYLFAKYPSSDGFGYDLGVGDCVLHEEYEGKWVSVEFSLTETLESAMEKTTRAVRVLFGGTICQNQADS